MSVAATAGAPPPGHDRDVLWSLALLLVACIAAYLLGAILA